MICDHAIVTDTAFEPEEVLLPNGETTVELTKLEIEYCPVCQTVEWRPEK